MRLDASTIPTIWFPSVPCHVLVGLTRGGTTWCLFGEHFVNKYDVRAIDHTVVNSPHSLGILGNLSCIQVAFSKYAIHERGGHIADGTTKGPRTHHHLHLDDITGRDGGRDDASQKSGFVHAERAREVAHTGIGHSVCEKVGAAADKLALEVPAVDAVGGRVGRWRA